MATEIAGPKVVPMQLEALFLGRQDLIIGHTGFKGIWVTILLYRFGVLTGYLQEIWQQNYYISIKINMLTVMTYKARTRQ
jgi:hypothetical protein